MPHFIQAFFLCHTGNQLYSVRSSLAEEGDFPYIIFRIMLSKIPLSHSKYGITIMDKEQALQSFMKAFTAIQNYPAALPLPWISQVLLQSLL